MKIVFMGSPPFAVPSLEVLHASRHQIAAVVTQPDRPGGRSLRLQSPAVKIAAHQFGIPVLQPSTTKTPEFLEEVAAFQPDALVVVAYGEILKRSLLELPPRGAINLHASLLPKYRGAAPIPWAILHGESETGATTMLIAEKMDAGPVLLQEKCPIHSYDTSGSLSKRISVMGAPLLKKTIDLLERNEITPIAQEETQASLAPKLKKENGVVDWNKTADWISRQIRAFDPWPGTFTMFQEIQVKLWLGNAVQQETSLPTGTIIHVEKKGILVACGEGTVLQIVELQPENKARMSVSDFVNGYHLKPRQSFGSAG
jgi:methionyl-tRNA formyltransferase